MTHDTIHTPQVVSCGKLYYISSLVVVTDLQVSIL